MSLEYHFHSHTHVENEEKHNLLHQKRFVRNLDRAVMFVGIVGPLTSLPQIWQLWTTQDAKGLSLVTWSAWAFFNVFWIVYGFAHRSKPVIINNILWFLINLSILVGIFLFS